MLHKRTQGYLIHAIAGAVLLPILYYYSLKKNSILCALIPTIPILGLYGLICTIDDDGNIDKYLKNIIIFGLMFVVLFLLMYFFYSYTNNIYFSSIISLIIWFTITMTYIVYC